MAGNIRTTPLRFRPSEHRIILFLGDLLMAVGSLFLALFTWDQYTKYVYNRLYDEYLLRGVIPVVARALAEGQTAYVVPPWFYLLPIIWVLLLVELYEPHIASSGRKTTRGIAIAAFVALLAYSLV